MAADLGPCLRAGAVAAAVSGLPSTIWAVVASSDPLEATLAAGRLLRPGEHRRGRLILAAGVVHVGLSLGWAVALGRTLPALGDRRRSMLHGLLFGLGVAAVDLGVARISSAPRFAGVRRLRLAPQLADHAAYGLTVGALLSRRADR